MNLLSISAMTVAKAEAEAACYVLNVQNLTTMEGTNYLFWGNLRANYTISIWKISNNSKLKLFSGLRRYKISLRARLR